MASVWPCYLQGSLGRHIIQTGTFQRKDEEEVFTDNCNHPPEKKKKYHTHMINWTLLKLKTSVGSSLCGSVETHQTSIPEDVGSIPGCAQHIKDLALP